MVLKRYLGPMTSPSKKVVSVGWSSVRPAELYLVIVLHLDVVQHTLYTQVAAKKRLRQVYVLQLDLNVVYLSI